MESTRIEKRAEPGLDRVSNAIWIGAAGGLVLLGTLVLALAPIQGPICLSRTLLHIPCPGCGLTRSLVAIWRGDLILSLRYHPFGPPLFAACALAVSRAVTSSSLSKMWSRLDTALLTLGQLKTAKLIVFGLISVWFIRLALWSAGIRVFLW